MSFNFPVASKNYKDFKLHTLQGMGSLNIIVLQCVLELLAMK